MHTTTTRQSQNLQVRLQPALKTQAEVVLGKLGLSTSQAIKIFLNQVIIQRSIPFDITLHSEYPLVSEEEEKAIGQSLKEISQGDYEKISVKDKKQFNKFFGIKDV